MKNMLKLFVTLFAFVATVFAVAECPMQKQQTQPAVKGPVIETQDQLAAAQTDLIEEELEEIDSDDREDDQE